MSKDRDILKEQLLESENLRFKEDNTKLSISEVSRILNVPVQTLRNWEHSGKLKPIRDKSNRRYYHKIDVDKLRMQEMSGQEFYIADTTPSNVLKFVKALLSVFTEEEPINISIRNNLMDKKAEFIVDSADGLAQSKRTLDWKKE